MESHTASISKRLAPWRKRPNTGNEKGFALLLSLLIIVLLVVVIFEADFQIRSDLRAAGNFRDSVKAFYLASSGISAAEAILVDDAKNGSPKNVDSLTEFWAFPVPAYPLGDGTLQGAIIDEERKINLNYLVKKVGTGVIVDLERKAQLQRLFELLKIDPELVDAIIDWIDPDDQSQPFGAEDDVYLRRDPPHNARNAKMTLISELRVIEGITDDIYRKIVLHLTVYGKGKINVNTADTLVLQSIAAEIDETEARRIIGGRPYKSLTSFKTFIQRSGAQNSAWDLPWFKVKSDYFSIEAIAAMNKTKKTARAIVKRRGNSVERLYFQVN